MTQEYSIKKIKLNNIINKDTNIIGIINDAVDRTSELVTHVYQFLRLWLLSEYDKTQKSYQYKDNISYNIPHLTKRHIQICFNVLTKKASNSAPLKEDGQLIYDMFNDFYEKEYKYLGYLQKIDGSYLSAITYYEVIMIKTCIENNIILHFEKYIKKYVNVYFEKKHNLILLKEKNNLGKKKELKLILNTVKKDLLEGTTKSIGIYKDWLIKQRQIILPNKIKYPLVKDINKKPQKYLPYMITMSMFCEQLDKSNYQFFPLRTSAISKYCVLDTKALVELFESSGKDKLLKNIDENKPLIWGKYFNMTNKIFKNNNYNFDYTILTNGETVSIRFISFEAERKNNIKKSNMAKQCAIKNNLKKIIDKSERDKALQEHEEEKIIKSKLEKAKFKTKMDLLTKEDKLLYIKNKQNKKEFKYIDELSKEEKEELHKKKRIYCDPGKRDLITLMSEDGIMFQYSNKRWLYETNKEKYKNKLNKFLGKPIKQHFKKKKKQRKKKKKGNKKLNQKKCGKNKNKNHIKYPKIKNVKNNNNKEELKVNNDHSIIDIITMLHNIELFEIGMIKTNTDHFNEIYNIFITTHDSIDSHIFNKLLTYTVSEHEKIIYNKNKHTKQNLLTQLNKLLLTVKKDGYKINKTNIKRDKLIAQIEENKQVYTIKSLYELNALSPTKRTIDNFINILNKYDNNSNILKINLGLLNNNINIIESKYEGIVNNLINFDKTLSYKYRLKDHEQELSAKRDADIMANKNTYNILSTHCKKKNEDEILKFINKLEDKIIKNNEIEIIKNHEIELLELRSYYELSNNTYLKMLVNIINHVKKGIYINNNDKQKQNVNNYIKQGKKDELFTIKNDITKIGQFKKIIDNSSKLYNIYTSPFFDNNNNAIGINNREISLEIERDMSFLRTRTCNIPKFKEYITYKNIALRSEYGETYKNKIFKKYSWYAYIDKQRALDNLLNTIESIYGPRDNLRIIYGDWSIGHQLSKFISTPMIGLKRKIASRFKVYNIDEYRTSMLDHKSETQCENLHLPDKHGKLREIHSILTYKMNGRLSCINRDYNAVLNMRKLTLSYLNNEPRPINYCRGTILDNLKNAINPQLRLCVK